MDDLEYAVLSDPNVEGFFTGNGGLPDESLADEVREKIYREELAEIALLREKLRRNHLSKQEITWDARRRGYEILDRRLAVTEAMYAGEALPEFDPLEPLAPEPGPVRAKPKMRPRTDARVKGEKYYTPTRACKRGHWKRLASSGHCVECARKMSIVANAKRLASRRAAKLLAAATI